MWDCFSFFPCSSVFYGVINTIDYVSKAVCSSCAVNAPQFSKQAFVLLDLSKAIFLPLFDRDSEGRQEMGGREGYDMQQRSNWRR